MLNILITGAGGFLGSALAIKLSNSHHQVSLLVKRTSTLERLRGLETKFLIGFTETNEEITSFINYINPDIVIHTACMYGRNQEDALTIADINIRLGLVLLNTMSKLNKPTTFINTDTALTEDVNAYSLSKKQFTKWGKLIASDTSKRIKFINVILQTTFGPNDDTSKLIPHILGSCNRNAPYLNLTSGEQKRDFIYITDAVNAYIHIINNASRIENCVDIDVGSGIAVSIQETVNTIVKLTSSKTRPRFGVIPQRYSEPMLCVANTTYLRSLGWDPIYILESGLKKIIGIENNK
jgi:nucleoside-diphosphate-sugar epimerase